MSMYAPDFGATLRWFKAAAQGKSPSQIVALANPDNPRELAAAMQILAERLDSTATVVDANKASIPSPDRLHLAAYAPVLSNAIISGLNIMAAVGGSMTLMPDQQTISFNDTGRFFIQAAIGFTGILAPSADLGIVTAGGIDPQVGAGVFHFSGGLLLSGARGGGAWMVRVVELPATVSVEAALSGATLNYIGVDSYRVGA